MTAYPICPDYGCHTPMTRCEPGAHYVCRDCGAVWIAGAVHQTPTWFNKETGAMLPGFWPDVGFEAQTMPGVCHEHV